jgi:transketolase
VRGGDSLAFIATGETVWIAHEAARRLSAEGVECRVLSMHTLRPLDTGAVLAAAATGAIVTVEEHCVSGGLGEACARVVAEAGLPVALRAIGLPDEETVSGAQGEVLAHYGICPEGLASVARDLLATRADGAATR